MPPRGVAAPWTPSSLHQALRCNHLLLRRTKDATNPRRISCCKATGRGGRVDRRDVLLGLGGAAAAAGLVTSHGGGGALASPIQAPDLETCHAPDLVPETASGVSCCLAYRPATAIVDFQPPPAQVTVQAPIDKPCACRFYLYFHERILGKLIGDGTFALPFWNWDAPGGMTLPVIYANESSPLYDEMRSATLMISGAKKKELFFGQPYRQGDAPDPGAGTIENLPHGPIHAWVGDPRQPNGEGMGNFYSAGRDPVFLAHHGNIDRLWHVWTGLRPGNDTGFTDADWLDAAFLFYDEDARPVRARVRDCLDAAALRYAYQDVALPWLNAKPATEAGSPAAPATDALPATLSQTVRVAVARPRMSRSRGEKEGEEEVAVVDGIVVADHTRFVKFDVFVNASSQVGAAAECAGSVVLTPHAGRPGKGKGAMRTAARFGICDLLDDIISAL
ncbi:unnamed protein product [Urochloa decumbens]|uniref:Tyrosinase copper-binding domain-containing protein n=1 Tax=Urochloa decumbens TaxID=240449 RepID=A0ABC9D1J1_9POAL